jgi:hypothetical protein
MNIITTTGYGTTGSSVVTDLLKEFKNVNSLGDFEFDFLSSVNGMRDLEYGLFELNSRGNTDVYIKQFISYIDYLSNSRLYNYEKWFSGNFKKYSMEFLEEVIDVSWDGYNMRDIRMENIFVKIMYYAERFYQRKILKQKDSSAQFYTKIMKKKRYYACPKNKEEFYKKVRKYTQNLVNSVKVEPYHKFIAFDQLVPSTDIKNYLKYFDDLKVIVVDRDPRDLYLLEKYEYKEMFIPYQDIDTFIKWYRMVRECKSKEVDDNILRVNFEDFIYDYDDTIDKIIDFCGLDKSSWANKRRYFDPDVSIKNTKKWLVYPEAKKEINYIEEELKDYLY